mgnify:CR=1 FL=1
MKIGKLAKSFSLLILEIIGGVFLLIMSLIIASTLVRSFIKGLF